jgi:hypothetical protein
MKYLLVLIFMATMLVACFFEEINPQDIVGKWTFTGFTQELERDGITWSPWKKTSKMNINSFYEFKSDGKFDYAPRSSSDSCFFGERYLTKTFNSSIVITFTDFKPSNLCVVLDGISYPWVIQNISTDSMTIASGSYRSKYARRK